MARARNLKPSFFRNEKLVVRSFAARLLYEGLWCLADRRGVLKDKPHWIEMEIFPADDVDIDALLAELADWRDGEDEPLIYRYEADGKRCIFICGFPQHNRPHRDEKKNELPDPPELVRPLPAEPCAEVVVNTSDTLQAGKKPGQHEEKPATCADSLLLNDETRTSPGGDGTDEVEAEIGVQVRHWFQNHPILLWDKVAAGKLAKIVKAKGWDFANRWVDDGIAKGKSFPIAHAFGVFQNEEFATSGPAPPGQESAEAFAARIVAKGNRGEPCTKTTN